MKRGVALVCAVMIAIACDRRDRFAAPDTASTPATAVPERSAYLSVSDLSPEAGAIIVVAGTVRVGDNLSLGSFRVRLGFDSTKLQFLEDIASADMFRVVNPQAGDVVIVGASSSGSPDGQLFAFRFRVGDPAGVNSLILRIDELNDVEFKNQKESVTRASALMVDRSLASKVMPRSQVSEAGASGSPRTAAAPSQPTIDSILPRSGVLESERVTDIAIYGSGFASRGNLVLFGKAEVTGLMSEAGGTLIRFSAPSIRVDEGKVAIRVKHGGMQSNAVTFAVKDDKP